MCYTEVNRGRGQDNPLTTESTHRDANANIGIHTDTQTYSCNVCFVFIHNLTRIVT